MLQRVVISKRRLLLLGIYAAFLFGKSVIGGELASEPIRFKIGVWCLRFTNNVHQITNTDITNMVEISSNLMVKLRDRAADIHLEGLVVHANPGLQTACDIIVDNHTTRYELSCMERQAPFATVTIRIYEDINKARGRYYAARDILIATDGQPNLLPVFLDENNKTDRFHFMAVIKEVRCSAAFTTAHTGAAP